MKRFTKFLLISLFAIGAGACSKSSNDKDAGQPMTVDVALPVIDSVTLHKTYPGYLSASDKADVVARVSGMLLTKDFKSGSHVEKGQVLYTIESSTYRDALQQAEANLATARSKYEYASHQYEAYKKALESDAVSQMDVIQAESDMRQAAASIKSCQAALNTARENLGYCVVRAPISGYISGANYDVGNFINGGGSPVVLSQIYNNDKLIVTLSIEDSQYEEMVGRNGGPQAPMYRAVPLQFAEKMPHKYVADMYYESPTVSKGTGTMTLKGTVTNIDNELKDGMYVTVNLPYGVNPKAVLVKDAAISTDQLGKYLYTVNDSDKIVYTPVTPGDVYRDSLRIITSGLEPGQRYVTKALLKVRAGEKVNPRNVKF